MAKKRKNKKREVDYREQRIDYDVCCSCNDCNECILTECIFESGRSLKSKVTEAVKELATDIVSTVALLATMSLIIPVGYLLIMFCTFLDNLFK